MPNDTPSSEDSIQTLIDSATVTHKLVVSGLSEIEETPFLRAVCEYVVGSIYRVQPFEYLIQIGEDDGDLAQTLPEELDGRFEAAEVVLSDLAYAKSDKAEQDSPTQEFETALQSGAVTYAQSGNAELANAVVTAEFAGLLAQKAANRIANLTIEAQESTITPRLDAIEGRFDRLEAALDEAKSTDFAKQLEQISKSLAEHADRLDGNLTQDRLDTLIALVTPTASQSDEKDISNERLATAIETLLQTMRETSQPTPALMDPYFVQLEKQSQSLIAALDRNAETRDAGANIRAQIQTFKTMAQSATLEGALSSSEKMEMLEEISVGLSALMGRFLSLIQSNSIHEGYTAPVSSAEVSEETSALGELDETTETEVQAELEENDPVLDVGSVDQVVEDVEPTLEAPVQDAPAAKALDVASNCEDVTEVEPNAIAEDLEGESPSAQSPDVELDTPEDEMELGAPESPEQISEDPASLSGEAPSQNNPELPAEVELESKSSSVSAADEITEDPAEKIKLEFESPDAAAEPEPAISKHMPTEDELDQRVEELLRGGPLKQADADALQRKTG